MAWPSTVPGLNIWVVIPAKHVPSEVEGAGIQKPLWHIGDALTHRFNYDSLLPVVNYSATPTPHSAALSFRPESAAADAVEKSAFAKRSSL
jgi:hypothetical protein